MSSTLFDIFLLILSLVDFKVLDVLGLTTGEALSTLLYARSFVSLKQNISFMGFFSIGEN